MAFTQPYTINFSDSGDKYLQFLHEVINTPLPEEGKILDSEGFRPPHSQNFYELIFFNSGSRIIRVEQSQYSFGTGDIFAVGPGQKHSGKSTECNLDRYYIHISVNAFDHLKNSGGELMKIFLDKKGHKITPSAEKRKMIFEYLRTVDSIVRFDKSSLKDINAYSCILRILALINEECRDSVKDSKNELFLNVLSYIENSYNEKDVIENITSVFGISRSSLWRMFCSMLDTTPGKYLLEVRLKNAKLLLENGNDVTWTAMECGFSDCSHFIKRFKERYSVTPLKYKKAYCDTGDC
ncbi:MAG: helix-turn-helix transcriptional regulator [Clostridia bacterium]|nr:helix-turn-helix transcriptional regulator [Clostridia bacterium]